MPENFREGDTVQWNWSGSTAEGTIKEVFTEKVTRVIKGSEITRNATEEEPAYLVVQEDGSRVLKSGSELSKS